jgi:hypothetical protein
MPPYATVLETYTTERMPNVPLAYVSVYRRMGDIFHTLAYASTIRNSVTGATGPLDRAHTQESRVHRGVPGSLLNA